MRISVAFGGMTMTVMLYDNPSASDLHAPLPLGQTIQDYSNNEKVVYLPRRLTQKGSGRPRIGPAARDHVIERLVRIRSGSGLLRYLSDISDQFSGKVSQIWVLRLKRALACPIDSENNP